MSKKPQENRKRHLRKKKGKTIINNRVGKGSSLFTQKIVDEDIKFFYQGLYIQHLHISWKTENWKLLTFKAAKIQERFQTIVRAL